MFINLQLSWTGISLAFWSGLLTPIIILELNSKTEYSETQKESLALKSMIFFGVGEVIGGIIMG